METPKLGTLAQTARNEQWVAQSNLKAWFSDNIEQQMDSLFSTALRLTRNGADAEDLVAETVSRAWTAIGTLEDPSRFRPWIFRILHNKFISAYRKTAVRPTEIPFEEASISEHHEVASLLIQQPDAFLSWWANPEREVINSMMREDIAAAIDQLPESFRVTVTLVNVEGLSYDEAAEVLGCSPGTIRSRMNRGRTLLQRALWQHARDAGLLTQKETQEHTS